MADARVTVLMPLKYYSPWFLAQALDSLFGQTDPRWRLLVLPDACDAARIGEALAAPLKDPRVRLVAHEGKTWSGTFNTGMRRAETPFVAPLLADDMWTPEAVAVLNRHIDRHPDVDFFHSARAVIDESGARVSPVFASRESFSLTDFHLTSPVKHLLCWRRELGLAVGGVDETLTYGPDDYDFPWTMAERGARFRAIPECLYLYRNHCEHYRLTTHLTRRTKVAQLRKILRKHGVGFLKRQRLVYRRRRNLGAQSVYASRWDRWIKGWLDRDPKALWSRKKPRYA